MRKIDAHMHVSGGGRSFPGCEVDSVIDAADRLEIEQLACSIPITGGRWATPESIKALEAGKGRLPTGIEVQVLDHGYTERFEKDTGKKADWFTTNGDVFPTGSTKMQPFPPVSPSGDRSFPRKNLSKGVGECNHYYVRAINGEVRLWVNGEEVSGGKKLHSRHGLSLS